MCLARCVRKMWACKYGTLDSALKISQNAQTFAPFPDTVPQKSQLWTSTHRTYSLSAMHDDCFRGEGQVSGANVRSRVVFGHVR